jgi:AcrR family transcriptional regulator
MPPSSHKPRAVLTPDTRRSQLLAAAATVFATRGYRSAGITDVVQTAGVARGTFYLYFASKADAFLAVADDFYDRLEQAVEMGDHDLPDEPNLPMDGRAILCSTFRRWLQFFQLNRHAAIIMLREAPAIDARFDRGIAELRQTTLSHFTRRVRALQERRLAQPSLSPDIVAHALVGMYDEIVKAFVLDAAEPDIDALAEVMADVAWNGLGRGPA